MGKYIIVFFLLIFSNCTTWALNNAINQVSFSNYEYSIKNKESSSSSRNTIPDKNHEEVIHIRSRKKIYKGVLLASLYTMYPLTVTFDIVTFPIQIVMGIYAMKDYSDKMAGRKF